jgi:GTP diphosphokinase / guanosine-3',5'-bis(diphosphate) 3'-diphosphatase
VALVHILSVEAGIDDSDVLCAAVLHDYLEDCCGPDTDCTLAQGRDTLRQRFGPAVLALVEAVTDDKSLDPAQRKRLQIEHAAHAPHGAKLVKLADKTANLRDLAATPPAACPRGAAASTSPGRRKSSTSSAARIRRWKPCSTPP